MNSRFVLVLALLGFLVPAQPSWGQVVPKRKRADTAPKKVPRGVKSRRLTPPRRGVVRPGTNVLPRPIRVNPKKKAGAVVRPKKSRGGSSGVVRSKGRRPGTLDTSGKKVKIDKDKLQGKKAGKDGDSGKKKVQDVIQWKSNLERGVECKKYPLNTKIRLDASDIALGDLTKFISCITGKNFIISGGICTF